MESEHGDSEHDEEEEEALCRIAEAVAAAGFGGMLASLDRQNAQVHEDEGQRQTEDPRVDLGVCHMALLIALLGFLLDDSNL